MANDVRIDQQAQNEGCWWSIVAFPMPAVNDCFRCITAHSLNMFLPQIGDFVQQVQLAGAAARRLDLGEATHCDSEQTHGRPLVNCPIQ